LVCRKIVLTYIAAQHGIGIAAEDCVNAEAGYDAVRTVRVLMRLASTRR
jgi:hypothetical protein